MKVRISLLVSIILAPICQTPIYQASAAECIEKACIDVYTQDGHIVIEGRKGSGEKSQQVIPAPSKSSVPRAKPSKRAATKPPSVKTSKKPPVKKPPVKKPPVKRAPKKVPSKQSQASSTSLEDKLIESIPTAGISYQPSFSPLVQTPVYFWSDIPTVVTKKVEIVGEIVNVRLRPTFIWHYGDGVIYMTRKIGAPFPDGEIRHTYSKPGHYLIELITRWDGEFTIDGVIARIPGELTTVSVLPITVVAAPIRFMN
jgi:hypothetical protein